MVFAFVHDHVFFRSADGVYYSDGKLVAKSWDRYLERCAKLYVICRVVDVAAQADLEKLDVSSREGVEFVPVDGVSQFSVLIRNSFVNFKKISSVFCGSDLVVLRVPSFVSLLAYLAIVRLRAKYCVEVVASASDSLLSVLGKKGFFVAWFLEGVTKKIVKNATGALYVTQHFLQNKYPNSRVQAIASNIELDSVDSGVLETRRVSKIDCGLVRLGLIGSYTQTYKGIDLAIHAISFLRDSRKRYVLDVVGKGDASELLELAKSLGVEDRVNFLGTKKAGYDIYQWLDTVDIYVQPSRTEGLPRALIEAMSRGCAVVASNVGGIPELIDMNFLHQVNDAEALANKIQVLAEDFDVRMSQSQLNFYKASQFYAERLRNVRSSFFRSMAI